MSSQFPVGTAQKGFTGSVCWQQDTSVGPPPIFGLPMARISYNDTDNKAYPDLVDTTTYPINVVAGVKVAMFTLSGVLRTDIASSGNLAAWLTAAFGIRTVGYVPSFILNILPTNASSPIVVNGVYFDTMSLSATFGVRGDTAMVSISVNGYVLNPRNITNATYGITAATALTPPANFGVIGTQISSYARCSVTNGGTAPTTYDQCRSFGLQLSNGLSITPAILDPTNQIAQGCVPGRPHGMLSLTQLKGATTAIPQSGDNNPLTLNIPTGDGSHTLKIDTSMSWNANATPISPSDFNSISAQYNLNATSNTNATGSGLWPVIFTYI